MISGKLVWFITVQLTVFTGCLSLNTNEKVIKRESATETTIPPVEAHSAIENKTIDTVRMKTIEISTTPIQNTTLITNNSTGSNQTHLEILEIFHGDSNHTAGTTTEEISINTTLTNCLNISSVNITCVDRSWNETFKTNYTTLAEAVDASEGSPPFRLQNTAAIAAGVFLISAVIGYFSCVGYRRFLQRKYGNSQILIGEEVYDTTDLRYFEI